MKAVKGPILGWPGAVKKVSGVTAVAVGCFLLLLGSGCSSTSSSGAASPDPAVTGHSGSTATVRMEADRLYPGDKIAIVFSGIPNPPLPHQEQIRGDGTIMPPLLNRSIKAEGKTIGELQSELQGLYVPSIYQAVTVTVRIDERYYFVGGEVKLPGRQPYVSEMTVLKAIQSAGDFTDFADRGSVLVTRSSGQKDEVNCRKALEDPRLDLPIYPGDFIHVKRRWP